VSGFFANECYRAVTPGTKHYCLVPGGTARYVPVYDRTVPTSTTPKVPYVTVWYGTVRYRTVRKKIEILLVPVPYGTMRFSRTAWYCTVPVLVIFSGENQKQNFFIVATATP